MLNTESIQRKDLKTLYNFKNQQNYAIYMDIAITFEK